MMYHLSFESDKSGLWIPRKVGGEYKEGWEPSFIEPDTPRICVSDSLEGCFAAIVPNIISLLREDLPMVFSVYSPRKAIITEDPYSLASKRYVLDAHVTREHWIQSPTEMKEVGKIEVKFDIEDGWNLYHPFNDEKIEQRWIAAGAEIRFL